MRSDGASESQLRSEVDLLQSRARNVANQSEEVGIKTMVALDEQNDKLKQIEQENDEIREEVRLAEENIREMEKCCGIFAVPWKGKLFRKDDAAWKRSKGEGDVVRTQPQVMVDDPMKYNVYVNRILNDDAGEDEMASNLCHVQQTVASLRNIAAGMNAQVQSQNKYIDGLIDKVNSNEIHVKEAEKRTYKLRSQ